jgi:hypothetical protein
MAEPRNAEHRKPLQDEQTKHAFAAKHGWDPREESGDYVYFRIVPDRCRPGVRSTKVNAGIHLAQPAQA